MMKKIAALFLTIFIGAALCGQTTVDYILKAKALIEEGNAVQASGLLAGAIAENKDSRLYLMRAEAKMLTGDLSGAISDFNAANTITAGSGEYGLARVYSIKGDPPTSVYHLEINLGSSLRKQEKEILLDPAFGNVENSTEWRRLWKKEWYSKSEKVLSEIEYYTTAGKIDESKALLNEIRSEFPGSDDAVYAEAIINVASGKYSDASVIAERLAAAHPDSEKYLRLLAKSQTLDSNPSGALVTCTRLLELGVADAQLYLFRAECYRKTGEIEKAQADVEKYLELYPADKNALSMAGKLKAASGDNLKAIEFFSGNIKLHPGDPECYIDRANSYFIAKSWQWAADDYGMALDLKPGNADAWLNKGIALLNSGNKEDACHDFTRAMSLGNKKASDYISRNCIR
jgi:tetratricopeptide (TPR) repeat protein